MNNKGSVVIWAFLIIFVSLFIAIFLGISVFTFDKVNEILGQNVSVGQVNLKNVTDTTFGQISNGLVNNSDNIGIILLVGMLLLMIINGYFVGNKYPKLFLIVDIFLLIFFFIPAVYVSQIYSLLINNSGMFNYTYTTTLEKTSKFMLNLPQIIASSGIVTIILSYIGIKRDENDPINIAGY